MAVGYLPHELKSESLFSHVHVEDVDALKGSFNEALLNSNTKVSAQSYRFSDLANPDRYKSIKSTFFALKNPFSGLIEHVVAYNSSISHSKSAERALAIQASFRTLMPMTPSPDPDGVEFFNLNNQNFDKKFKNFKLKSYASNAIQSPAMSNDIFAQNQFNFEQACFLDESNSKLTFNPHEQTNHNNSNSNMNFNQNADSDQNGPFYSNDNHPYFIN